MAKQDKPNILVLQGDDIWIVIGITFLQILKTDAEIHQLFIQLFD